MHDKFRYYLKQADIDKIHGANYTGDQRKKVVLVISPGSTLLGIIDA